MSQILELLPNTPRTGQKFNRYKLREERKLSSASVLLALLIPKDPSLCYNKMFSEAQLSCDKMVLEPALSSPCPWAAHQNHWSS